MKLNDFEFEIEVISKTEFIDDYTVENQEYRITSWFLHLSRKAVGDYLWSELPSSDWQCTYNTREEYEAEYNKKKSDREKWEQDFKKLLGQENANLVITNSHAEFFTAVKIEKIQK